MKARLRVVSSDKVPDVRRVTIDPAVMRDTTSIVEDVKQNGIEAVRRHGMRLKDISPDDPLLIGRDEIIDTMRQTPTEDVALLERVAQRIRSFASSQLASLGDITVEIQGGLAGHCIEPVEIAGCYAPGGRFPLPSSVLMTAIPARVAGVKTVYLASPRPNRITMAAAAIANVDGILTVGGAQAIAAMAYGIDGIPPCDIIVGPGNEYVTCAKQLVSGYVAIDMLAGPSELVILADKTANPDIIAADLLAQAEHDSNAVPIVVTTGDKDLVEKINQGLQEQLATLPDSTTASMSISNNGLIVMAESDAEAVEVCNRIAPEHLELIVANPGEFRLHLKHYGAIFIGSHSAEVFGDYGVGPNHVLPTSGTARSMGGLSVFNFLRTRTWLKMDSGCNNIDLIEDCAKLARLEGLEAHARAAEKRLP